MIFFIFNGVIDEFCGFYLCFRIWYEFWYIEKKEVEEVVKKGLYRMYELMCMLFEEFYEKRKVERLVVGELGLLESMLEKIG